MAQLAQAVAITATTQAHADRYGWWLYNLGDGTRWRIGTSGGNSVFLNDLDALAHVRATWRLVPAAKQALELHGTPYASGDGATYPTGAQAPQSNLPATGGGGSGGGVASGDAAATVQLVDAAGNTIGHVEP